MMKAVTRGSATGALQLVLRTGRSVGKNIMTVRGKHTEVRSPLFGVQFASKMLGGARIVTLVNLGHGAVGEPIGWVLERAAEQLVSWQGKGISVAEMGYRTRNFHEVMEAAEDSFRRYMEVPDNFEVHFFNGGATLQFAAIPMNLCGPRLAADGVRPTANYIMNGHWADKAANEARMYIDVNEVWSDSSGLYFTVPPPSDWQMNADAVYTHYTAADTRQGFEWHKFPYEAVPKGQILVSDMSANMGSRKLDWERFGVVYAASHKNFSTSGQCYTCIRRDLIQDTVIPGTPTLCNWWKFQTAPNKIYSVPVILSIWIGQLCTDWMLEMGGLPYFDDLASRRSSLLYDYIDDSNGFYRTFVTDARYRSRMQVVFTIGDGKGANADLVAKFLHETGDEMGWLDIKSHPLGLDSDAIRVTMYNHQPIEVIQEVQRVMHDFRKRHQ